jgi:Co-chaperonin GroES (HSP10)
MKFPRLLGNRLLVEPISKKEEKVGSIIIPGTANANLQSGKIVAVSIELENFQVGETVLFPEGCGTGDMIGGKSYLWLQATEIWAIENEEAHSL